MLSASAASAIDDMVVMVNAAAKVTVMVEGRCTMVPLKFLENRLGAVRTGLELDAGIASGGSTHTGGG